MLKLTIGNSLCQLDGLTREQYSSVKMILSYKVQGSFFSGDPNGGVRSLVSKKGIFASGLLPRVQEWLRDNKLGVRLTDLRKRPIGHPGLFTLELK